MWVHGKSLKSSDFFYIKAQVISSFLFCFVFAFTVLVLLNITNLSIKRSDICIASYQLQYSFQELPKVISCWHLVSYLVGSMIGLLYLYLKYFYIIFFILLAPQKDQDSFFICPLNVFSQIIMNILPSSSFTICPGRLLIAQQSS